MDRIITDTGNKYKKDFVKESPAKPEVWFPLSAREQKKREKDEKKVKVVPKGMHRWRDLPEPVDVRMIFIIYFAQSFFLML